MTGRKLGPRSETTKAKISESLKGEKNPMFGKVSPRKGLILVEKFPKAKQSSPEHKAKLSAAKVGKPRSLEARAAIVEGMRLAKLRKQVQEL